jgi:hypothetical protein
MLSFANPIGPLASDNEINNPAAVGAVTNVFHSSAV